MNEGYIVYLNYKSELSLLILLPLSYFVGVKTKKAPFKEGAFC